MNEIQGSLDSSLEKFEHALNIAGYVPLVSSVSGVIRAVLGKIEVIGGIATGAILAIAALFNPHASQRHAQLNKAAEVAVKYSLHGVANLLRGTIEVFPLLSLVTCLPYDLMGNRFSYFRENFNNRGVFYIDQVGAR
jgi:hypothetical protein